MIQERRLVTFAELLEVLEVSPATLKRDLEYMRNRLNAPIVYDRRAGGYRFDRAPAAAGGQYELPGLWFSASEIHALLTMQHLLANLDPGGILTPHVEPLMTRLTALMGSAQDGAEEIRRRVIIFGLGKRTLSLRHFERVGAALLRRKRMIIRYYSRGKGEMTEREVSPQRLVHYRENWYLDAWCHLRGGLRNFAVDSIREVDILEKRAREVSARSMDAVLGPGYGIFSGRRIRWARLRFSASRARWVASESWHPRQRGDFDAEGSYVLEFPFSDSRELLMDVLKYGADVEVLAPQGLRRELVMALDAARSRYPPDSAT